MRSMNLQDSKLDVYGINKQQGTFELSIESLSLTIISVT